MKFDDAIPAACEVLRSLGGNFATAYQVAALIRDRHPDLWGRIAEQYRAGGDGPLMGEGAGVTYSPASYIAHTLNTAHGRGEIRLVKAWLEVAGVEFSGIKPASEGRVSIWAWREFA
jgi:hypothetical protein